MSVAFRWMPWDTFRPAKTKKKNFFKQNLQINEE